MSRLSEESAVRTLINPAATGYPHAGRVVYIICQNRAGMSDISGGVSIPQPVL